MPRGLPKGKTNNPNGRPKGSQNKLQKNIVEQLLDIHEKLETKGIGLEACAFENPKWFNEHFLKGLIPKNINMESNMTIIVQAEAQPRKEPDAKNS